MKYYIISEYGSVGRLLQERADKVYQLAYWYVPPLKPPPGCTNLQWNVAMTAYVGNFTPRLYQEVSSLEEFKEWWVNENFLYLL